MFITDGAVENIGYDGLLKKLRSVFMRHGVSESNAAILAENCAMCERDGSHSHGIFRIPGYLATLKSGWVDGNAVPLVEDSGPSFLRVDAANGFAQPALAAAIPKIFEQTNATGVSVVAIRDSHHFSALWPDIEAFAEAGLVALSMVSGLACVVPPGGHKAVFGTNPFAFATPIAGAPPLVFDFATSMMSNGDLRLADRTAQSVPLGTGIDEFGNPSSDPHAILNGGALLPFGGHKGAALSLMVEIMASALTGGQFSSEVDFSGYAGAETPRTGQLLIVIDPERSSGQNFASRVAKLVQMVRDAGQSRLPSDRRLQARANAALNGIPISRTDWKYLTALAG